MLCRGMWKRWMQEKIKSRPSGPYVHWLQAWSRTATSRRLFPDDEFVPWKIDFRREWPSRWRARAWCRSHVYVLAEPAPIPAMDCETKLACSDIWEMDPTESCGCRILSPFCLHEARVRYHMRSWNRLVRDLDDAKVIVFWPAVLGEQVDPPLKLISVGPQIFTETGPGESDHPSLTWLSNKPDHSVIYIAFGSYFSHGTTHQIDYLFNALGASGLSVLFSRVGGDETMHKHVDEGIGRLGEKGLACDWVPQEQVLAHPVSCSSDESSLV